MRTYIKKSVREMERLVKLRQSENQHIPDAFNLDCIPHYCILGRNMITGRTFPCTLTNGTIHVGCTYFAENECEYVYRAIMKIMIKNPNLKLAIFNTAAMYDEPKFWRPKIE